MTHAPPTIDTVEAVVRQQLSTALGGRRGMLEAAVPTITFTVTFLTTKDLRIALVVSVTVAAGRCWWSGWSSAPRSSSSSTRWSASASARSSRSRAARAGGDANDQALAYFLPGLLYNAGYAVVLGFSILVRWPLVGFMVGSVTGDPTAWHKDKQVVRLCSQLTWVLVAPVRPAGRGAGADLPRGQGVRRPGGRGRRARHRQARDGLAAAAGRLALMVWLLARNRRRDDEEPHRGPAR